MVTEDIAGFEYFEDLVAWAFVLCDCLVEIWVEGFAFGFDFLDSCLREGLLELIEGLSYAVEPFVCFFREILRCVGLSAFEVVENGKELFD